MRSALMQVILGSALLAIGAATIVTIALYSAVDAHRQSAAEAATDVGVES